MIVRNFKFIYCVAKGEIISDKDHDTKEYHQWLIDHQNIIRARYEVIFHYLPHFRYDFTEQSTDEVITWLKSD